MIPDSERQAGTFKVSVTPELTQGLADHLLEIAGDRLPVDWSRAVPVAEDLLAWLQTAACSAADQGREHSQSPDRF